MYAAAFAGPVIANVAFLLQNGRLPWFLDIFTMYGGPWLDGAADSTVVILLLGFLLVVSVAAWAAWLVWNGSRQGVLLSLALLPVEAACCLGFALPFPLVFGIARAALLIRTLKSSEHGKRTPQRAGGRILVR